MTFDVKKRMQRADLIQRIRAKIFIDIIKFTMKKI